MKALKNRNCLKHAGLLAVAALLLLALAACARPTTVGDVMASVNGHKIYRTEVDKYYANQTAGSDQQPAGEQAVSLRLSILNELIETEILMQRAEKLGLLPPTKKWIASSTKSSPLHRRGIQQAPAGQENLARRLQARPAPLPHPRQGAEQGNHLAHQYHDQDVSNYYNEHKAEFNLIEAQYHLAKIMVSGIANPQVHNLQNSKAQNEAEAHKKIEMIANHLDSGDDFATLAMNYSRIRRPATTAATWGWPRIRAQNRRPATRDAVMKLKPGQYTPVIPIINPATHQPART